MIKTWKVVNEREREVRSVGQKKHLKKRIETQKSYVVQIPKHNQHLKESRNCSRDWSHEREQPLYISHLETCSIFLWKAQSEQKRVHSPLHTWMLRSGIFPRFERLRAVFFASVFIHPKDRKWRGGVSQWTSPSMTTKRKLCRALTSRGKSVNFSTLCWSTNVEGRIVSSQSKMMALGFSSFLLLYDILMVAWCCWQLAQYSFLWNDECVGWTEMDRVVVETCWFEFWSGSAFWGKFLSCLPARDQQNQWGASRASLSRQLIFVEPPTNNLRRRRKKDGVVFPSTSRCLNGGMPKRRSCVRIKERCSRFLGSSK